MAISIESLKPDSYRLCSYRPVYGIYEQAACKFGATAVEMIRLCMFWCVRSFSNLLEIGTSSPAACAAEGAEVAGP